MIPQRVRFKASDLALIKLAAKRAEMLPSAWIREAVLDRTHDVLDGRHIDELTYETAHGVGKSFCIRFPQRDLERVFSASRQEQVRPSTWIRAIAVKLAKEMMG